MMSTESAPEPLPGSVIDLTGQDTFAANAYCQWITANGATGICVIRNSGSNLLTCVVSGAPSAIQTINGLPFNGLHTLEPNLPTAKVAAIGDFLGTKVTIFNMSDLETPCFVVALTSASQAFLSMSLGELLTNPEGFLTEA